MNDPVTMRRKLRAELKRLRTASNLTQRAVAETLDWSPSKVIRIENGSVAVGVTDLHALLRLYGEQDGARIGELEEMARGSKRQPFASYKDLYPAETLRYFAYESSSVRIRQFELAVVPALLQTEEYAKALLRGLELDRSRIDQIWDSRVERQELLDRQDMPEMFFILDEAVIRRAVGGEGVMRSLREHLLLMSERPGITIQILPFAIGAYKTLTGPFVYLEFEAADDPDVLYLERPLGDSVFRDDEEVTGPYLETFYQLEKQASAPNALEAALA